MNRLTTTRSLRWFAALIVLALAGWYAWAHRADFAVIARMDPRYLAPMIVVPLLMLAANGWIGRLLVRELNVELDFSEWYGLACISALGNYLPIPQAGSIARGVYLRRIHDLSYAAFTASVLVTYVFFFVIGGAVGMVGLAIRSAQGAQAPWQLWFAFGAMIATVLLFVPGVSKRLPMPRLGELRDGWRVLGHPKVLTKVAVFQALLLLLNGVGIWLAYLSVRGAVVTAGSGVVVTQPASLADSLMLASATQASGVLNVTPGNVGVAEGALGVAAMFLNLRVAEAVVAYSIFRIMCMTTIFTTGPAYSILLSRRKGPDAAAQAAVRQMPLPSSMTGPVTSS